MRKEQSTDVCQPGCYEIGQSSERRFIVLGLCIKGKLYVLNVATVEFAQEVRAHNQKLSSDCRLDESFLVVDHIGGEQAICALLAQMSFETLRPYLVEQVED